MLKKKKRAENRKTKGLLSAWYLRLFWKSWDLKDGKNMGKNRLQLSSYLKVKTCKQVFEGLHMFPFMIRFVIHRGHCSYKDRYYDEQISAKIRFIDNRDRYL